MLVMLAFISTDVSSVHNVGCHMVPCLVECRYSPKKTTQLSMDIQTCIGVGVQRMMIFIQGMPIDYENSSPTIVLPV